MRRALYLATGMGVGAVIMFFADPSRGRRRRAWMGQKMVGWWNRTGRLVTGMSRDMFNRSRGIYHEAIAIFDLQPVSDTVLRDRVRSEIGRAVSHSRSIRVRVEDGCVVLSGPIPAEEVDALLTCVSSVKGVRTLQNRLQVLHWTGLGEMQGAR